MPMLSISYDILNVSNRHAVHSVYVYGRDYSNKKKTVYLLFFNDHFTGKATFFCRTNLKNYF
jgi:hypothetical protein